LNRKQRFGVAAALTWAVLHLCDSPWLEKTLENENIHMFLECDDSSISNNPYFSCKFTSTTTNSGRKTPDSSPAAQFQSIQVPNHFFFTLAICLIELGRNKLLADIRHEYRSVLTTSYLQSPTAMDDFEVAKMQYDELVLDPGQEYANAVDQCLKFLFPGNPATHSFKQKHFRKTFFDEVVAPIQATYELIPDSFNV
jgi:hypothetical protein